MIAIVHSIYSQSVHEPASHARLMDNEAERYCSTELNTVSIIIQYNNITKHNQLVHNILSFAICHYNYVQRIVGNTCHVLHTIL